MTFQQQQQQHRRPRQARTFQNCRSKSGTLNDYIKSMHPITINATISTIVTFQQAHYCVSFDRQPFRFASIESHSSLITKDTFVRLQYRHQTAIVFALICAREHNIKPNILLLFTRANSDWLSTLTMAVTAVFKCMHQLSGQLNIFLLSMNRRRKETFENTFVSQRQRAYPYKLACVANQSVQMVSFGLNSVQLFCQMLNNVKCSRFKMLKTKCVLRQKPFSFTTFQFLSNDTVVCSLCQFWHHFEFFMLCSHLLHLPKLISSSNANRWNIHSARESFIRTYSSQGASRRQPNDKDDCQNQFIVKSAEIACRSMWKSIGWQQFAAFKFILSNIPACRCDFGTIKTNIEVNKKSAHKTARGDYVSVFSAKCHRQFALFRFHLVAFFD